MTKSTTSLQVRRVNRNRIFRYLNQRERASMPDIAAALSMSVPTVLAVIKEFVQEGLVREVGELRSTGGRKAKAYETKKDIKYSIGLDITKNHVGITYTNLTREALNHKRVYKPFSEEEEYFQELSEFVQNYIEENKIPKDKILGISVSIPGIFDEEDRTITASHALQVYDVPVETWERYLPYPCHFINDANAAAIAECSVSEIKDTMIYLLLSNTVGGALLLEREERGERSLHQMYLGKNFRSCEFGHIVIRPGGKGCYCGKAGCVDAYCSALTLEQGERLEHFFEGLAEGREENRRRWDAYLNHLVIALDNLRMSFDCQIVLGGYVGRYLKPYMEEIRRGLEKRDIFKSKEPFVFACKSEVEASALGGAILVMESYLDSI